MTDEPKIRLGGMALRNGVLVHSHGHWAAAVRTPDGAIHVGSGRKPELPGRLTSTPMLRGVVRLTEAVLLLPVVRTNVPEARLPMEGAPATAAVAAVTIGSRLLRRSGRSPVLVETLTAGLSVLPAAAALRSSQLARYHGAEHKAIGGYEQDREARLVSKEHERCGSHMVGPMLLATAAANAAVAAASPKPRPAARALASLAAMGAATEAFGWMTRNGDHPLARLLARPGHALQRFASTREPDAEELEVAQAAVDEVLRLEHAAAA